MAKSKTKLDDDRLIAKHIDPNTNGYGGRADARTRSGVPVWALIGHMHAVGGSGEDAASAYELPSDEVEGALAYYRRNKDYIDARLLLNSD